MRPKAVEALGTRRKVRGTFTAVTEGVKYTPTLAKIQSVCVRVCCGTAECELQNM